MKNFPTLIGSKEFIIGSSASLAIVAIVSLGGSALKAAMAPVPTPQQLAALDIPVQQQTKDDDRAGYEAYLKADGKLIQDQACVSDASQCPLAQGTTPAR